MRINSILNRKGDDVATVAPERTVADALGLLADHGIGALVVSNDGQTVEGILSERDIVRALAAQGLATLDLPVHQLMTDTVVTCTGEDTVDSLMATMTGKRIRHVPVVEDGVLSGIISIGDVVKHRLGELESETRHLKDYITTGR
ncbi:MAG: CBS domain-containing protein [Acidimicrobiales bacterium]